MLQRILTILYLIFYIGLSGYSIFHSSPSAEPLWLRVFEGTASSAAIICIIFYLTKTRPNSLRPLFKIIPFTIIITDVFSNAYAIISPAHSQDSVSLTVFAILLVVIMLFPSWYICFRFGYLDELKDTAPQTFKKLAIYMYCAICSAILIPLLVGNPLQQELALALARILGPITMLVVLFNRLKTYLKTKDTETQIPTK